MFNTNTLIAAVGALIISTACVATAVGPAAAFERSGSTQVAAVQTPASAQASA